ncbi:MAG TPA: PQQ-binding-like beta-propeller repeat protein [Verrucomicrobiales bacterium]|nr:PQQ-binding-like beta-propeller repeat protein [Verrucomicrobiales bacterium]
MRTHRRPIRFAHRAASFLLAATAALVSADALPAADWQQWRGPNRDGLWSEDGVLLTFPEAGLTPKWKSPVASGYSGPTVAEGKVYVADKITDPSEQERIHCFDAATGEPLWTHAYNCAYQDIDYGYGPRASVTVSGKRAFFLGAMGHAAGLDAVSGEVLWQRDLREDFNLDIPVWGLSSSPIVVDSVVILQIGGPGGACVVGLDAATGTERWRSIEDRVSYTSPILIRQAERDVVVCSTANRVAGLDPASGAVLWDLENKRVRLIDNVPTPVHDPADGRILLTSFYNGTRMLRANPSALEVQSLWERRGASERRTDALHPMIATPFLRGNHIFGVDSYGELRCLDAANGDRLWEDQSAVPHGRWSTLFFVQNGDRTWIFSEEGFLIIAELSASGYREINRTRIIEPTTPLAQRPSGVVCWVHPAFANRCVYIRNDRELVCLDLSAAP